MIEVFTTGGGAYVVRGFNAVAAWTQGGGYIAFLEVVTVLAFIYAMMLTVFDLNWKALFNWFMGSTLIYGMLMVPTTSVKVTDTTNPTFGAAVVDNVPMGLGLFAGLTSQISHWLTTQAEVVFSSPASENYSDNGMIYGARLLDQVQSLDIDDPIYGENLDNYIKKCVLYDLYLGRTSLDTLVNSTDAWAAMQSPSVSLYVPYKVSTAGVVTTDYKNCVQAYAALNVEWSNYFNNPKRGKLWKSIYPDLSESMARTKLMTDLPVVYGVLTTSSQGAEKIIQQHMMMNAFMAARAGSSGSEASASIDAFAQARADIQTSNTYNTIASGARKWVPILNMILTVVFYCLFPVLFPLFLLPQTGWPTLKGYVVGFFYLAAWGPLYVILNMFLVTRYGQGMEAAAGDGGITLSSKDAAQSLNNSVSELSGYLLAMVPFLAAGIARGALAIGNQSHSFLQPQQRAAEAAASDMTMGNHSLGNLSWQNLQANNASTFQQNLAPSLVTGSAMMTSRLGSGATERLYRDNDRPIYDYGSGVSRYFTGAASNANIAANSEKQASVLQSESTDLRGYQSTVSGWGTTSRTATGGNRTNASGTQGDQTTFTGESDARRQGFHNSTDHVEGDRVGDSFDRSNAINLGARVGNKTSGSIGLEALGTGVTNETSLDLSASAEKGWRRDQTQDHSTTDTTSQGSDSGFQNLKDNGFRNSNGSFYRVSRETYDSWSREQQQTYNQALGQEISRTESASRSFSESASQLRSNSMDVRTDLSRDFESFMINNRDLAGFTGGGAALLRKSPGDMNAAESAAFNKAVKDFEAMETVQYARQFSDDSAYFDTRYGTMSSGVSGGYHGGNGGGAPGAPRPFQPASPIVPVSGNQGSFDGRVVARELGIGVKARSVNLSSLDGRLEPALRVAASTATQQGLPGVVITSGNDSTHKEGSRHYTGDAFDLRGNNISVSQGKHWAQSVQAQLGAGYFVDFEVFPDNPEKNHLHVQTTGPR